MRKIIFSQGTLPKIIRKDRIKIDPERIGKLYVECDGFIRRIHEKLKDEDQVLVSYPTLTRMVRGLGLGETSSDQRDSKVPDRPGAEMQHDTSPYEVKFKNGKKMRVVASLIYFRYSKMRYLVFYPSFTRFRMKCFFHEALIHFGFVAWICVIDNTNLAVLHGTGPDAVMVPEMVEFGRSHGGFKWKAHKIRHSDRKGGVESGFHFIETNFFPGREFEDLEDLNAHALEWSTVRLPIRPHSKTKLIPAQLFEIEKAHLKKLPRFMPDPILTHERGVDQYGYAAFDGNYYWVPGRGRGQVQVIQHSKKIRIFRDRQVLAEYPLPAHGMKNERFPEGPLAPKFTPNNCKRPVEAEEKRLRSIDPSVSNYVEFVMKAPGSSIKRHRLIRFLFQLSRKLANGLFVQTVSRAHRYRIQDRETIERIATLLMRESYLELSPSDDGMDEQTLGRIAYREGELSEEPDFTQYEDLMGEEEPPETGDDDGKES